MQEWARERNMDKGRVSSMISLAKNVAKHDSITPYEMGLLYDAAEILGMVMEEWDKRSGPSVSFFKARREVANGSQGEQSNHSEV